MALRRIGGQLPDRLHSNTFAEHERIGMDSYIGTIMAVGFNFAPRGWMLCQGQTLQISQNTALFSLLGNTYGGDGHSTFALPDLRGRTLVGQGQGQGLRPVELGQKWGNDSATMTVNGNATVSLSAANLPPHTHPVSIAADQFSATTTLKATMSGPGSASPAEGATLGSTGTGPGSAAIYVGGGVTPDVALNAGSVSTRLSGQVSTATGDNAGSGAPFQVPVSGVVSANVVQPSLGINYVICVQGVFPSRN